MINIGTAIFLRIIEEQRERGFQDARSAAIRAIKDTMKVETARFCTFNDQYVEGCAKDRFDHYVRDPKATPTNQVLN